MKTTVGKVHKQAILFFSLLCFMQGQAFAFMSYSTSMACPEVTNTTLVEQENRSIFCEGQTAVYIAGFPDAISPVIRFFWDTDLSGIPNEDHELFPVAQQGNNFSVEVTMDASRDGGRILVLYEDLDCPDETLIRTASIIPTILECGINISDPCVCLNNATAPGNGQFAETITITGVPGQTWTIVSVEGLFQPGASVPADLSEAWEAGDVFTVDPDITTLYILEGVHADGQPYSITVSNGTDTLSIGNLCFYPDPEINLLENYCVNFPPFNFEVTDANFSGTFEVTVNGDPATQFNAGLLGPGIHNIVYTFFGDSPIGGNPPCESERSIEVEVFPNYPGALSCFAQINAGLGPDGTFTITPDALLSDDFGCTATFEIEILGKAGNVLTCEDAGIPWMVIVRDPIRGSACMSVVIAEDKMPPVFVCEDVTVSCTEDLFSIPVDAFVEVSDNCGDFVLTLMSQQPIQNPTCNPDFSAALTRTIRATDMMGNSSSCTQTIFLDRPALADIVFPEDITLFGCAAETAVGPEVTGFPSVNGQNLGFFCEFSVFYNDVSFPLCAGSRVVKRTWRVIDQCGAGTRLGMQEIIVEDNEAPTLSCPADLTLNMDINQCFASYTIPALPFLEDNCVPNAQINVIVFVNGTPRQIGQVVQLPAGENSITYNVNDPCFNYNECTQIIEVFDNQSPTLVCNPITAALNENGEVAIVAADLLNNFYFDNCAVTDTLLAKMDDPNNLQPSLIYDCSELGVNMLLVQVSDAAGNVNTCMLNLTIQDKLPPTIVFCPPNQTLECGIDPVILEDAVFQDNCTAAEDLLINFTEAIEAGCCNTETITRTWSAVDSEGNESVACMQVTEIIDTTGPDIECLSDVTIYVDQSGQALLSREDILITAEDACCEQNLGFNLSRSDFSCDDIDIPNTVTLTVLDWCDNSSVCTANIIVLDTLAPVFVSCQDSIIFLVSDFGGECANSFYNPMVITPTAIDNCTDNINVTRNSNITQNLCALPDPGIRERLYTFTATDAYGNTAICQTVMRVIDDLAPELECVSDITLSLDADGQASVDASTLLIDLTDSCDNNPALIDSTYLFICDDLGSNVIQLFATDCAGNLGSCSVNVLIEDPIPPVITCPDDITVECLDNDEDPSNTLLTGVASATDNCSFDTPIPFTDISSGSPACVEIITRTFTVTDIAGNTATCVQTITIEDNTAPVNDCDVISFVTIAECEGSNTETILQAIVNQNQNLLAACYVDNCGNGVNIDNDYISSNIMMDCEDDGGFVTVTYSISDDCGNAAAPVTITIQVIDRTGPEFTQVPADLTLSCEVPLPAPDLSQVTAVDACSAVVDISAEDFQGLTPWIVTASSGTGEVEVDDDNNTITITGSNSGYIQNLFAIASAAAKAGMFSFDWTYETQDEDGPFYDQFGILINGDTTVLSSGASSTQNGSFSVDLDAGSVIEFFIETTDNILGEATAVISNITFDADPMECPVTDCVIRRFVATDACGNQGAAYQLITFVDVTNPEILIPAQNEIVECDGAGNTAALDAWLAANGNANAVDNCTVELLWTNDYDASNFVDACGASGSVTVVFTAIDDCGNTAQTTASFIIEDTTNPSIDIPASDLTVECDGSGNETDLAAWLANNGGAAATDVCGSVTWSNDYDADNFVGGCAATGSVTVVFTATDECGNTAQTTATFTIEDTTDPSIDTPASDSTVECDGSGNETDLAAWLANNGGAVASDACGSVTWSNDYDADNFVGGCAATGNVTVVFTAIDECGNTAQSTATFTIEDTTDPSIDTPASDLTVECDGSGNATALAAWLTNNGGAVASDACGSVTWSNDYDADNFVGGCAATGSVTVVFTATDDCGNTAQTTATFTIEDTTDPSIDTPASDLTVECDGSGNGTALAAWLANKGGAVASDACGSVTWSNDYDANNFVDGCGATGSVTVIFTATDDCGNTAQTTATFTIEDTTDPSIDTPASDLTVECDGSGNTAELAAWLANNGGAVALDACGSVTWTNDYDVDNFVADCGSTGTVTVVFTATDDCGNTAQTTATFIIEDTTDPSIDTPASDLTVECDGSGNSAAFANWLTTQAGAVASDICGGVSWSTIPLNPSLSNDCGATGQVTVTFVATDDCGNSAETTASFIILDTTAPVIMDCPADVVQVNLSSLNDCSFTDLLQPVNWGISASDNCSGTLSIGTGVLEDLVDFCEDPNNLAIASGTSVFTVSDACGNTAVCNIAWEVTNNVAPILECVAALTVALDDEGTASIDLNALVTNLDYPIANCFEVSESWISPAGAFMFDCSQVGEDVEIELTASVCGSPAATCTVSITVLDPEPIQVQCSDPIEIDCLEDLDAAINDFASAFTSSGICLDSVGLIISQDINNCNLGSVSFDFTATSFYGTSASCSSEITVVQVVPFDESLITWPEDFITNCTIPAPGASPQFTGGPSFDPGLFCIFFDAGSTDDIVDFNMGGCRTIERIWTVTDTCTGLSFSHTQIITFSLNGTQIIQAPSNVVVGNEPGACGAQVDLLPLIVTDCTGDVVITNSFNSNGADASGFYEVGVTTVTYTITGGCEQPGSVTEFTITVEVVDTQSPQLFCGSNVTTICSSDIDAVVSGISFVAMDNCPELTLDTTLTFNLSSCGTGTITILFTAADLYNQASCLRTISVLADPNFELSLSDFDLPTDVTLACGEDSNPAVTGAPMALSDLLCADIEISFEDETDSNAPEAGCTTITRTWTIEDACSNITLTHVQSIVISSDIPVIAGGPSDITVSTDPGECSAFVSLSDLDLPACATDLVVTNDFNNAANASDVYPVGTTTVLFTVVNACGNSASFSVDVTVEDNEAPMVSCPSNVTLSCLDDIDAFVQSLAFGATDNCTDLLDTSIDYDLPVLTCGAGTTTVTFTATDESSNTASCTLVLTITPEFLAGDGIDWPVDMALACDQDEEDTEITGTPEFDPLCGNPITTFTDGSIQQDADNCSFFIRTWIVSDACSGLTFTHDQQILVPTYGDLTDLDNTVIMILEDKDPDECGAFINLQFPVGDFCAPDVVFSNSFNNGGADASGVYPVGTTVVTYTISNNCDTLFTAMAIVTIQDLNAPVVNCSFQTAPVSCEEDILDVIANWNIVVIEPCAVDTSIFLNFNLNDCGVGTVTFIFQVTDQSDNTGACTRTITVGPGTQVFDENSDIIWPVSPLVVEGCDADIDPILVQSEPELLGDFLCLNPVLSYTDEEIIPVDNPAFCGQFERTWILTSSCDAAVLATFVQTIYLVEDGGRIVIEGMIQTPEDKGISEVDVYVTEGSRQAAYSLSDETGHYRVRAKRSIHGLTVTPDKTDQPTLGVSSLDLLKIGLHVRGEEPLQGPYSIIAADVNRDGRISSADMRLLRDLILRRIDNLPQGNWRFVAKDYSFVNPDRPLREAFDESVFIPFSDLNFVHADFVAVKMGDVIRPGMSLQGRSDVHSFYTFEQDLREGQQVKVPVHIRNFNEVAGFQVALEFDPAILRLQHLTASTVLKSEHMNLDFADQGLILVSWDYTQEVAQEDWLMELSFSVLNNSKLSEVLHISESILSPELYRMNASEIKRPVLDFIRPQDASRAFELFQNEPNPFSSFTRILFSIPTAEQVSLTVYDMSGRVVHYEQADFDGGLHAFYLNHLNLQLADGTYFYRLKAGSYTATKKMILSSSSRD